MPYSQSYLELEAQIGGRDQTLVKGSPESIRTKASASAQFLSSLRTPSDAVTTEDGQHSGVRYRIYRPRKSETLPVGIWAHGGGLMIGDLDTDDHLCRILAEEVACVLISVDYRLSPEHKVPAHLEDVLSICHWAHRNATRLSVDPNRMFVGGVSAGGSLALQVANKFASNSSDSMFIKGVLSLVPFTVHPDGILEHYRACWKFGDGDERVNGV